MDPSHVPAATHELEASDDDTAANFPFDLSAGVNEDDLIAQLPPQKQCDELKNVFFEVFAPVSSVPVILWPTRH